MVGDLEVGFRLLAEALDLDVLAVVLADRHGGVDHLRNLHQIGLQLFFQLRLLGFKLGKLLRLLGDKRLLCLGFFLHALAHQHADLLGDLVAIGAQLIGAGVCRALLGIHRHHFVDERQLVILKLLADILLDKLGILTDKFYVQHDSNNPFNAQTIGTLIIAQIPPPVKIFLPQ